MKRIMYYICDIHVPVAAIAHSIVHLFDDTLTGATAVTKYFRIPICDI
jgi:hypothetical protein